MYRKKIIAFAFLALIGILQAKAQELKLNLEEGQSYYHNSFSKITTNLEIHGEILTMVVSYDGKIRYTVKERNDHDYRLKVQFESLRIIVKSGDEVITADSENMDSSQAFSSMMDEITKISFELSLTEHGFVTDVSMDSVFENLFNSNEDIPELQRAQMIYLLRQSFGEEAMKGATEMITAIYPIGPVSIGDEWENQIQLKTVANVSMNNHFKLIERNQDFSIIEVHSKTFSNEDESFIYLNGEFIRYITQGTMDSFYKIDTETGWIIESEVVQNITGLNEKKWKEDSTLILKIPFTHSGTITIHSY